MRDHSPLRRTAIEELRLLIKRRELRPIGISHGELGSSRLLPTDGINPRIVIVSSMIVEKTGIIDPHVVIKEDQDVISSFSRRVISRRNHTGRTPENAHRYSVLEDKRLLGKARLRALIDDEHLPGWAFYLAKILQCPLQRNRASIGRYDYADTEGHKLRVSITAVAAH
jgi:hypothetical protein